MNIFFDLDETLITSLSDISDFIINLEDGPYEISVRRGAKEIVEQCRLIAPVYILTTATLAYASAINEHVGFGFKDSEIFHRLSIADFRISKEFSLAHPKNILIDNLPPADNITKMAMLGIGYDRYIEVSSFYGHDIPYDMFGGEIIEKINELVP